MSALIHLRTDDDINSNAKFACGATWPLPEGDTYYFEGEFKYHLVTCPGCGGGPREIGTPLSQLSGQPGHPGYERFKEIARSWGYK